MKKIFIMIIVTLIFVLSACSNVEQPAQVSSGEDGSVNLPEVPDMNAQREKLYIYEDGQLVNQNGYSIGEISSVFSHKEINGDVYYAASISDITGKELGEMKGAFLLADDGYINYTDDLTSIYLASHKAEDGIYKSVELKGKLVYGGICSDKYNKGVTTVYLVSTPAEFNVDIQINGESVGKLTMSDFMKKTMVGEKKVSTGLFDGSFLYNYGESIYEGKFLGIGYETMLAKLSGMGIEISKPIVEVEYYGVNSLGVTGKNEEYSTKLDNDKYYGICEFFCMYDGKTFNTDTYQTKVGLSTFINGTGGRWITYNLEKINIITE